MFSEAYRNKFQNEGLFYVDMWPLAEIYLVVFSPTVATAVTQTNTVLALKKPYMLPGFFKPITGGPNLFDMQEPEWRPWRAIFSKAFNTEHFCHSFQEWSRKL
jgi:hypothetical protein